MNLEINEREKTVLLTALDNLRDLKQRSLIGTNDERAVFKALNQYDILAAPHTLMHSLSLLSKLTGRPIEHFTRNPSQDPQPKTHEPAKQEPSSAP
jgi:hypothetical protein